MNPLLSNILVSACLGALIGLIRQWNDQQDAEASKTAPANTVHTNFGGVRTFSLWALLGCLAAFASQNYISATLPVTMGLVGAHLIFFHLKDSTIQPPGGTSFASAMLTCLIGALVYWGHIQSAIIASALTMVMLGIKHPLHTLTKSFTFEDIRATLQFAAITGVILPLVPNQAMGPYQAFNPYTVWLMVVLISGISFLGYVLMRMLGAKAGITVTGLVGGLASSTATTLAFSKRSQDAPELSKDYALAVILACTMMYLRLALMIGLINMQLLTKLAIPSLIMAAPGVLYALWALISRRSTSGPEVRTPTITNPLNLKTSIKFALIYAVAAFLIKVATACDWKEAVMPLAFLSGLTSPDAISLLMANNHNTGEAILQFAAQAVIVASLANTLAKGGIAMAGTRAYVLRVTITLGLMVVLSIVTLWLV